jgi:thiol-disulfide isomerase/thioredoxin
MKPGNKRWWKTATAILVLSLVSLACSLSGDSIAVNTTAPDFTLSTVGGRSIQLSQFRGRAVVVNFWATWCSPCRAELPLMQNRFEAHYPDLVVLAIEEGATKSEIYQVMIETGVNFLVLRGNDDILARYGVSAFPTTFFIDKDGVVRSRYVGQLSPDQIDDALRELGLE